MLSPYCSLKAQCCDDSNFGLHKKNEKVALAIAGLFSLFSNDLPINSNFAKVVLLLLLPYVICFIDWQT